ncbi:MAG TPA: MaoC/PaaZ C-terminal domain-containing protein [Dermatophilaceae bacterium]|nr:MaoC/PaaZ C-terminal domain-containing protein [Dermatophilaceae bacterium]
MRTVADVEVGQLLPARTVHVDRARLVQYAGASLDRNPIHWDERFATSVGLPDVIAHGMWTMGAAGTVVTDWCGDAGRVLSYSAKFAAPVVVPYDGGADVEITGKVTKVDAQTGEVTVELAATCRGEKVLGRTVAVVRLDTAAADGA